MKTLTILFFILFATSFALNAQITKGNWMVGGDATFLYADGKIDIGGKTFTMRCSPNIGYFFFDKMAAGIKTDYTFSRTKVPNGTSTFEMLSLAPFARYYFLEIEKPTNVFLESSYSMSVLNNSSNKEFILKGGTAIFLNSSVAFEIALEYANSTSKNVYIGDNKILLNFGIQVHLEKER